jgi:hypothetical protein
MKLFSNSDHKNKNIHSFILPRGIKSALFFAFCFFQLAVFAQYNASLNPFLKEKKFFNSIFEEQSFYTYLENPQNPDYISLMMASTSNASMDEKSKIENYVDQIVAYLSQRKSKNNIRYLSRIFSHIHIEYLKKYRAYSSIKQLFNNKIYDCVTGTYLYALVMKKMGIQFQIYENTNHTYLIAQFGNTKALFESTDPLNGFVVNTDSIELIQSRYAHHIADDFNPLIGMVRKNSTIEKYKFYQEKIHMNQLIGLYYFNQGVVKYNLGDYQSAIYQLEKAFILYNSPRIMALLLHTIQQISKNEKETRQMKIIKAKMKYYTYLNVKYFN